MVKLGIAITTFNRTDTVFEQIQLINKFSLSDYVLVVCDDGSTDNTLEQLKKHNIPHISGANKGIAWNKNRGLYYLANYTQSEAFLLLDDDIYPTMYGWDVEWGKGAQLHGYISYAPKQWDEQKIFGNNTATDPAILPICARSSIAISREVFPLVGYMDNRFDRYGHEHTDYSSRFVKAGYGGILKKDQTLLFATMNSGLSLTAVPSCGSVEEANRNEPILHELANDPLFRLPWFTEEQKIEFLDELKNKSHVTKIPQWKILEDFDKSFYLTTYPDVKAAGVDPVTHYYLYGQYEKRKCVPD
ncbi:hypothetical protein COMNV_01074 [Commensalibacter sp. Nvir]|uniref:glycosyltransferase family 2 protein n=1 Tax=Commensalibacter sp. Nvir TaxID=3069817 RepID=UPI002D329D33|nr:hypothetical protein COMNV_01074 [Commensalibacter sp. Nvir]